MEGITLPFKLIIVMGILIGIVLYILSLFVKGKEWFQVEVKENEAETKLNVLINLLISYKPFLFQDENRNYYKGVFDLEKMKRYDERYKEFDPSLLEKLYKDIWFIDAYYGFRIFNFKNEKLIEVKHPSYNVYEGWTAIGKFFVKNVSISLDGEPAILSIKFIYG